MTDPERVRLADADAGAVDWRRWGPYVAERAWGTVREDYSADFDAWRSFPHDHARSRTYRWNEDGMAGICDESQFLCFALALWNGRDPILKERMFGVGGKEGNHGEDVKEYWWYLDATPTHSWLRWRYHYPIAAFPYEALVEESLRRTRNDAEFELLDTGVFDEGWWEVTVDYAKAGPDDVCVVVSATNRSAKTAELHLLPTLWLRNTWSWGRDPRRSTIAPVQTPGRAGTSVGVDHGFLGRYTLTGEGTPATLFCDNETNRQRLYGVPSASAFPKDAINDHVVSGAPTVNPAQNGSKCALWYRRTAAPGETITVRLRLAEGDAPTDLETTFDAAMAARAAEADAFYAPLAVGMGPDEALVQRRAYAGLCWSEQFYHYDVDHWLDGDPAGPPPPMARLRGRNADWRHLNNRDVLLMPDPWEYPWYASWDLAFHCVAIARIDPGFAKEQLVLLCREWFMHPNGQLPAYEWAFGDVNPPVHAWAALRVFEIDGSRDHTFLRRVFHKLLLNFTWWVNRKDAEGNNIFEGGFLGLDNIGPVDRSRQLAEGGVLEQSDASAWMAMYALDLLQMALALAADDASYEDLATKFFEHFCYIATAMVRHELWDDELGFFTDVIRYPDGRIRRLEVRSVVGLVPLCATMLLRAEELVALPAFARMLDWFVTNKPEYAEVAAHLATAAGDGSRLLAVVRPERLVRILGRMLDEAEFLSPYGLRSLSRAHLNAPFRLDLPDGGGEVGYEPAESASPLFGGNSNWRGPVWFPINQLLIEALVRFGEHLGDSVTVELPTGSGTRVTLDVVARDLARRQVALFLRGPDGRRPCHGGVDRLQNDPHWRDNVTFFEYFHGDNGAGLGGSHQTGWTALVAELLLFRR